MTKKLVKHGNSLALIIDKPILDMLKINEKTDLELSIEQNVLTIRVQGSSPGQTDEENIDKIAKKIIDKYGPVFKKLAQE